MYPMRLWLSALLLTAATLAAVERPGTTFKIFQFPANQIPRIDGKTDDWAVVPDSYTIATDQIEDTLTHRKHDPKDLDVKVKVGWVKGMNRLYFLYEAYDNYWDFARPHLHNDIFELVVDADLSGGGLIKEMHPARAILTPRRAYNTFQGVHAQNYHILTPPGIKSWAMVWGCQQPWLRELPYSNAAYDYHFQSGESGKLTLEFWITPFDYADCTGPGRSIESQLKEDELIGLSWSILDYDDPKSEEKAFWNLSHKTTMYGDANAMVAFRLMPLEPNLRKPVELDWTTRILDEARRQIAINDQSTGPIQTRKWDFGDGATSTETNPIHTYAKPGPYDITLEVTTPQGPVKRIKTWEVVLN